MMNDGEKIGKEERKKCREDYEAVMHVTKSLSVIVRGWLKITPHVLLCTGMHVCWSRRDNIRGTGGM